MNVKNMKKITKVVALMLIMIILSYCILTVATNNKVQARERTEDIARLSNYPEIYTLVQELKTTHPNWTFTLLYTGLDWNDVIYNETTALHTRSLVHNSLLEGNKEAWLCPTCGWTPRDNGSWYCASNATVSYYMDPRNWLNETYIFAFETLSFNSNVHTVEGVQAILAGTFMDKPTIEYIDVNGIPQVINKSYAQVIYEAGQNNNVSPYHLAARIRQEQGNGTSSLISGNYEPYVGYYNYFNIGASGNSTADIIRNGLARAKDSGWSTPELSINGGAEFLKGGYIGNYQDTLYLQKYHVDSASKYSVYGHQYQQNVSAPFTESLDVYDAYEELGILNSSFNFIIPIYENMPAVPQDRPGRYVTSVTENVIVETQITDLSIRSGPSTNYTIKAKAPKGTILTRIERAEEISSDGRYWDRVVYNTGSQIIIGYASREYLGDVGTTEVVNEVYTVSTMCNLRNGPTTTNTKITRVLSQGTQVTVIDKILFPVDNHIWYRVKLMDGTQGFVSSAYLQSAPVSVEKYEIDGELLKVTPETQITEIDGAVLEGTVFGTGAKVTLNGANYTVVMLGDVSGDGNITPSDYVKVKNNIMGITVLENAFRIAADVNGDNNITPADYVKIKNHIMKVSKIGF